MRAYAVRLREPSESDAQSSRAFAHRSDWFRASRSEHLYTKIKMESRSVRKVSIGTALARGRGGFSLIELLTALAITAIVASIFFQSIQSQMQLAAKVRGSAANALGRSVDYYRFQSVAGAMIAAWPGEAGAAFRGGPEGFSGVTRSPLRAGPARLLVAIFALQREPDGVALTYDDGAANWVIARFPVADASLRYLGADGEWRPAWPPEENPDPGPYGDARFFATPQLPLAVRIDAGDVSWIAPIESAPLTIARPEDVFGGEAEAPQ